MIKSLPKTLRVQFVPAPDTARKIRAWIDERYPALPGSGASRVRIGHRGRMAAWPDLPHVFTQAAIDTVGAQIHPEVLTGELWEKLPAIPADDVRRGAATARASRNAAARRTARTWPGEGTGLRQIPDRAATAVRRTGRGFRPAAWSNTRRKQAGSQGKLVEQANLLHKAGRDERSRARRCCWRGALDALRMPSENASPHAGSARRR